MIRIRLWDKFGLRGKVLFAISAVVLSILFIIFAFSYNYSKNLFEGHIKEELEMKNEVVAQEINTLLKSKRGIAEQLGELEELDMQLETIPQLIASYEINNNKHVLLTEQGQILFDDDNMWPELKKLNISDDVVTLVNTSQGKLYVEVREIKGTGWQIIDLSHNLGFNIVAEGVETVKQLELLTAMETDVIQGFYYSKPLNKGQLHTFLDNDVT